MIVADKSALIAILRRKPEPDEFVRIVSFYCPAKARGLPLLFKGNDFSQTDLVAASRIG